MKMKTGMQQNHSKLSCTCSESREFYCKYSCIITACLCMHPITVQLTSLFLWVNYPLFTMIV